MIDLLLSHHHYPEKSVVQLSEVQAIALSRFREKLRKGYYKFEITPCLCGNTDGKLISQHDRYALPVNTWLCRSCGTMWTNPRMTKESLIKFYEEDYRLIYSGQKQIPNIFFQDQVKHGEKIYRLIKPYMRFYLNMTVFDIGCGAGGTLIPFKNAGWYTYGCDVGLEYLQHGKSEGLILEQGEATTLKKYAPANVVILSHVLEHLPCPIDSIRQISNMQTENSFLYIELPGIFRIRDTYGGILPFLQNAHLYYFTLTTLSALLSRLGYRQIIGNEWIEALFQKDATVPIVNARNQYSKILRYLYITTLAQFRIIKYFLLITKQQVFNKIKTIVHNLAW